MTQQFWTEFLELYKENSCLWDIHSSSYLRRDLRNAAYNILLEKYRELDPMATLDMVKRKIDIFRTGFRREQRKVNEQNLLPDAEYKPTLWYYNLLSFLNNYQDFDSTQEFSVIKECNESDDQNGEATIEYIDIPDDYSTPNPVTKYRLKKRKLQVQTKTSRTRSDVAASSSCSFFDSEEDDCASYCASLKLQMRELDREQKYIAQKLISDVIFLARTSQLTLESSINTQPF